VGRVTHAVVWLAIVSWSAAGCSGGSGGQHDAPAADPTPSRGSPTATATDDGPYQPTEDDRTAIRDLLETRAAALSEGDRAAFMATVDTEDPRLVRQQRTLFANLQRLPVESVSYSVDDASGYPVAEVGGDDPVFRPLVVEQVELAVDALPVSNQLEDTFVRRDGSWLLGAESLPGKYHDARGPQSRPWAGGVAVAAASSGRLVVVVDRARARSAVGLADQMTGYIRFAASVLDVEPTYAVLVDATSVGDTSALNTVDDSEAAATTATVLNFSPGEPTRLAGTRIKVNPETAVSTVADVEVMRHELTHFLTLGRLAGAPIWVKEGIAEWVSTAPAGLDGLVAPAALVRHVQQVLHRLPTNGRWGLDPRADYLVGRAAVTHLVQAFGVATVFEMARAYRSIDGDDPDQKTARVLQRVIGITEAELVRATWGEIDRLQRR